MIELFLWVREDRFDDDMWCQLICSPRANPSMHIIPKTIKLTIAHSKCVVCVSHETPNHTQTQYCFHLYSILLNPNSQVTVQYDDDDDDHDVFATYVILTLVFALHDDIYIESKIHLKLLIFTFFSNTISNNRSSSSCDRICAAFRLIHTSHAHPASTIETRSIYVLLTAL